MSELTYGDGVRSGITQGLVATLKVIVTQLVKNSSLNDAAYQLKHSIDLELQNEWLKVLGRQHFFHEIWKEEPVRILAYYPYEKKCVRGPANEVLSFDYTEKELFLPLKQKLEELYRKATNNKYFHTDNKTVYVYTVKGGTGDREVAVMFKDGRAVFGSPWNVQNYY